MKMKKNLAALLAAVMLFSQTGITAAAQLPDNDGTASAVVSAVEDANAEETAAELLAAEEETEFLTESIEGEDDSEELFDAYVERTLMGISDTALFASSARAKLNDYEKEAYDYIYEQIKMIADGRLSSTAMTYTFAQPIPVEGTFTTLVDVRSAFIETQFSFSKVVHALLADCPYELYWFNKSLGFAYNCKDYDYDYGYDYVNGVKQYSNCSVQTVMFYFKINASFADTSDPNEVYLTDTTKTSAASQAAVNAGYVVDQYSNYSDSDKLYAYKKYICDAVSYDRAAVEASHAAQAQGLKLASYDSWQLIYVFDNDPNTNVVCEGYSKAFKLLCDMTEFENDIYAICVTGSMGKPGDMGGHMWNNVSVNGKKYIADITNSDSGTVGQSGGLFMNGMQGDYLDGYSWSDYYYIYDSNTLESFTIDELMLERKDFDPSDLSDSTAIDPPDNVSALADINSMKVTVSWSAVSGATGYKVYKAYSLTEEPIFQWLSMGENYTMSFDISESDLNRNIYYYVTAMNSSRESDFSAYAKVSFAAPPAAPEITSASYDANKEGIYIVWGNVENAAYYRVSRTVDSGTTKEIIADNLTTCYYVDKNITTGHTYHYYVASGNSDMNYCSDYSTPYSVTYNNNLPVPVICDATIDPSNMTVSLSWTCSGDDDLAYIIYKAESLTGEKQTSGSTYLKSISGISVTAGKDYYFFVTSYDNNNGIESDFSAAKKVTVPQAPSAPSITSCVYNESTKAIDLKWTSSQYADYYKVFRKTDGSSDETLITQVTGTSYSDTSVTEGTTYVYRICAGNSVYGDAAYSQPMSVTASTASTVIPDAPKNLSAEADHINSTVKLTWNVSDGAEGYKVFKATDPDDEPSFDGFVLTNTGLYERTIQSYEKDKDLYFCVKACNDAGESEYSAKVKVKVLKLPTAPSSVSAKYDTSAKYVTLTWGSVNNASAYRIYRTVDSGSEKELIADGITAASYIDKNVQPGHTYNYYVASKNTEINYCSELSATAASAEVPAKLNAPVNLAHKFNSSFEKISLTWDIPEGGTTFNVYRAESLTGTKVLLGTTYAASYSDSTFTYDKDYYYFVTAYSSKASESDFSAAYKVNIPSAPGATVIQSVKSTSNSVTLTWASVKNAESYVIYRGTGSTDNELKYAETDKLTFTDTSVYVGKTYYYRVSPRNSLHTDSSKYAYSEYVSVTIAPPGEISAPEITDTVMGSSGMYIYWNEVPDASYYYVYRADSASGTKTKLAATYSTNYCDSTAVSGKTYYYFLQAYNSSSYDLSDYSSARRATATVLTAPGLTDSAIGDAGLYLYWNKIPGATSYRVYRADSASGTKIQLTTTANTSYVDPTAVSGKTYYYYVTAFNSITNIRSAFSTARKITMTKISTPSLTDTCIGDAGLYLYWSSVPGATSYRVYRADSASGTKQQILVTASLNGIDTTAVSGKTYYYYVAAFNNQTMIRSAYSTSRKVTMTKISTPSLTDTCIGDAGLYLYWSSVPGATSYRIYRADSQTGTKKQILVTANLNGIDTTAVSGKTYYYFVAAFNNKTMIRSAYSNARKVTMTKISAPIIRSAVKETSGVTLSWSTSSGATSYRVYRADSLTGAKTLLTVQAGNTFTDKTAVSGKTYYYYVAAFNNQTMIRSAMSSAKSVTA